VDRLRFPTLPFRKARGEGRTRMIFKRRVNTTEHFRVCKGCYKDLYPGNGYLIYIGELQLTDWKLAYDSYELYNCQPYDLYCEKCTEKLFPKVEEVGEQGGIKCSKCGREIREGEHFRMSKKGKDVKIFCFIEQT